ncbi:MAG: Carbamate kinase [Parachlamydiales bacterium]|nr:Carbamate kinase [Parachlamydiales bacterium]
MKVLMALGGNALLQRGQPLDAEIQMKNVSHAAKILKGIAKKHQIVLCHGNGPQVGLLSLISNAYKDVTPYPLDVLVAETQGMIGYMLQNALFNEGITNVVTLLTQVKVDPNDPAFLTPTKPVGPVYDKETALKLAHEKGWEIAPDGKYYRRVVASPLPKDIVEFKAAQKLIDAGYLVIFCGGGGIPVAEDEKTGFLVGREAVIDKDRASALAAIELKMDMFIILTDVDAIYVDWGTKNQKAIQAISPAELKKMDFARGSMGPKVEAACDFVVKTGKTAIIGDLFQGEGLLNGTSGTMVKNDVKGIIYY